MIPSKVHYAYTSSAAKGGMPFSFIHYLAIRSALINADIDHVILHYISEPTGSWWTAIRDQIEVRPVKFNTDEFNVHFDHPAHKADALRLQVLRDEGGIFLDLDVIILKSLRPLRQSDIPILGREDSEAVCCAVIMAPPNSVFIERWIRGYNPETSDWQGFRSTGFDDYWGEISTQYPAYLAATYPTEVCILPTEKFYPVTWRDHDLDSLFTQQPIPHKIQQAYTIHLWQTGNWHRNLEQLTPQNVSSATYPLARILTPLI